jgi:hypothetical protein
MSPQSNHGQKVTLGENAPITQESTGAVASDSLAAESQSFQSSNSATPRTIPHSDLTSAAKPYAGSKADGGDSTRRSGTGSDAHVVDEAPGYVSNQFRDAAGPHGKNVTEDNDMTRDGAKNASFTEFGTKNDPARLAEEKIVRSGNTPASGMKGEGVDEETAFSALNSSEEA